MIISPFLLAGILTGLLILVFLLYRLGLTRGIRLSDQLWQEQVGDIRKDAISRSRSVLAGKFSENLAPYLPDFPWSPTECRFIGAPVDFLVFRGMDSKNIEEVIFVEVKSGKSSLNSQERHLREVIQNGRVSWREIRIDPEITATK